MHAQQRANSCVRFHQIKVCTFSLLGFLRKECNVCVPLTAPDRLWSALSSHARDTFEVVKVLSQLSPGQASSHSRVLTHTLTLEVNLLDVRIFSRVELKLNHARGCVLASSWYASGHGDCGCRTGRVVGSVIECHAEHARHLLGGCTCRTHAEFSTCDVRGGTSGHSLRCAVHAGAQRHGDRGHPLSHATARDAIGPKAVA